MQAIARTTTPSGLKRLSQSEPEPLSAILLPLLVVLAAACMMFFGNLGDYPLFNPDESLYAEPAREMLDTGEYVTTLLNYVVRFTKPPLVIWAMAGCYKLFGVTEFAARFFGASCGVILVGMTFLFLNKYATKRAALLASLSLVTAPLFIGTAREAITDMPLSLFIAGALMAFYHGFQQEERRWKWLGYALVGLAVMTKGPVGLILPAGILGAYHVVRGEFLRAWRYYSPVGGLLVVGAIAIPWFATEIYVTHGAYYQEFLVRENFQRFTSVVDHKGAWWYHIAAIAGGFLPWSIFAPQALWLAATKRIRGKEAALPFFCLLWFTAIVVFFSASVSKLLPYTLPAFPALAILTGIYLDKQIEEKRIRSLALPLLCFAVVCAVALYVVPVTIIRLREMPPMLPQIIQSGLCILLALAVTASLLVFAKRQHIAIGMFAAGLFLSVMAFGKTALDVLSAEWEGPIPAMSQFASLSGQPVVVWHMRKHSVPFYARRQVIMPGDVSELQRVLGSSERAYIIGKTKDLDTLSSLPRCRVLVKQGRFVLLAQQPPASH